MALTGGEKLGGTMDGFEAGGNGPRGISDGEGGITDLPQDLRLGVAALLPMGEV